MTYSVAVVESSTLLFLAKIIDILSFDGFVNFPSQEDYAIFDGRCYNVPGNPKLCDTPVNLILIDNYIEDHKSELEFIRTEMELNPYA